MPRKAIYSAGARILESAFAEHLLHWLLVIGTGRGAWDTHPPHSMAVGHLGMCAFVHRAHTHSWSSWGQSSAGSTPRPSAESSMASPGASSPLSKLTAALRCRDNHWRYTEGAFRVTGETSRTHSIELTEEVRAETPPKHTLAWHSPRLGSDSTTRQHGPRKQ